MAKQNQPLGNSSTPIWAQRIADLLRERKMTQLQLAQMRVVFLLPLFLNGSIVEACGSLKSQVLRMLPMHFGVSTDYLLGANECTTPTNEEIHNMTGLSDKAIKNLRKLQRDIKKNERSAAKKIAACNYLLERMNSTSFFELGQSQILCKVHFG